MTIAELVKLKRHVRFFQTGNGKIRLTHYTYQEWVISNAGALFGEPTWEATHPKEKKFSYPKLTQIRKHLTDIG